MIKIIKQDIADFEERNAAETKQKLNEIWGNFNNENF